MKGFWFSCAAILAKQSFPSLIYLIARSKHSEFNSKKIYFSPIPPPQHQFQTELLWGRWAKSLWRLMVRKRSQSASFSLLHYPPLLSKTVLLMTSVHKSNLKRKGNKCSAEEGLSKKKPLTQRRRGGNKGSGEDQKINQEAIWHPSALETPTTVYASTVLPSVRLHSLREQPHKSQQLWTEGSIVVWFWWMETEAVRTNQSRPPE